MTANLTLTQLTQKNLGTTNVHALVVGTNGSAYITHTMGDRILAQVVERLLKQ